MRWVGEWVGLFTSHIVRCLVPPHVCCTAPQGVLALNVPVPGLRRHFLLTKTLEWNLYWWVWWVWCGLCVRWI